MARAGRNDRELLRKKDSTGRTVWSVWLYHEGRERRFGSISTKTAAREFDEKAKQEQKTGRSKRDEERFRTQWRAIVPLLD